MERFAGKVAVVTGAGNGIGRGYAAGFAGEGATVVVADIDADAAREAADAITKDGGNAVAVAVDVADEGSVAAMGARCAELGGADVLVNNAGLHMGQYNLCSTLPLADWRRILDVNLLGAMLCARELRPQMAGRGGGVIVNQSSSASRSHGGAYAVSKLALNGLTVGLAAELAPDGIRVVGVAPGMIGSDAVLDRLEPENKQLVLDMQMVKRFGQIEDLVGTVLFLCSPEASFITGQTYFVDGGAVPGR